MSSTPPELTEEEQESELRFKLLHSLIPKHDIKIADEWLRKYEARRSASSEAKRDAREEETLSIAKRALSIAEDANTISRSQAAVSVAWANQFSRRNTFNLGNGTLITNQLLFDFCSL